MKEYIKADSNFYGCACCGNSIPVGGEFLVCPDCGAIFCKECVEDGRFENHDCEDVV